jgi:hypothetical protein
LVATSVITVRDIATFLKLPKSTIGDVIVEWNVKVQPQRSHGVTTEAEEYPLLNSSPGNVWGIQYRRVAIVESCYQVTTSEADNVE